jgi:hypothetical protein
VPLTAADQIPVGSILDTTKGQVRLTSAADASGTTQSGLFKGGLFRVEQKRGSRRPFTDLTLTGGALRCRAGRKPASVARRKDRSRHLFSNVRGRFRTRGRHSVSTVRGTKWLTKDSCRGTLTLVSQGVVVVRDLRKHRSVTLTKGQRYLARP